MIVYFLKNETNFNNNGLGILDNYIINPVVTEEINGIFKLEFDYPTHATHGNELIPERIVRCPVPDMPDQLFRVAEREAAIGGIFHVVAYHVFYDLAQNLIEDTFIVNKNGTQAMTQLLGATQFSHGFSSSSNIDTYHSARMVRLNAATAILDGGTDNSFLSRWGGEIIRDNFLISMQTVRGSDNGVCIRDKKNLTGYRSNVDYGTVVTRIMTQGYNGLMLPEKYVDSPRIGDYQMPHIRVVKYDKVKAITGEETGEPPEDAVPLAEAYTMLRTLAAKEYSVNHIDVPNATYKIEFAPLERCEEYKDFTALETIHIGDTVRVVHEEDALDISARMISYTYDPLVKAYIAVNLGNAEPKFTSTASEIRSVAVSAVQQAAENGLIVLPSAGNDRAVNYYGSVEPPTPRVGDLWFKENGDKLELWIYETRDGVTQWYALLSDLMFEEMRQELAQAALDVEEAKAKAQEALEAGEAAAVAGQEALAAGQSAQNTANQATVDAQSAVSKANDAFNDAVLALNNTTTLSGRVTAVESSITQTANTIMATVNEAIGIPFKVQQWERGSLNTTTGAETVSSSYLRSGYISVAAGERYISQLRDGTAVSMAYFYYTDTEFLSYRSNTSSAITVPASCTRMRIRVSTTISPDSYTGNVYAGTVRQDYTKGNTVYSSMLMQKDIVNLRVSKDDVINQINISTEGILIAGEKIHITGTTTIDNAVIQTAMIANAAITTAKIGNLAVNTAQIADAAITNAKIANLSAAKITTGTLSADRIAAGSITSAKLTIANGFITNAMIADATIQSAKIGAIDASKITTGTLSATRIGAGSITADKVVTNFLQTLTGTSSIRITGTTISYYSGSTLSSQINSSGFELRRDDIKIGRIGTNSFASNSSWRGLVFDLEYAGNYMAWAWKTSSSASAYTVQFSYYRSKLQNGQEKGFHFDDVVYFKGGLAVANAGSTVTNTIAFSTFSSANYLCRHTTNFKAGLGLGGSNLLLGSQGTWVNFNTIRSICAQLAGKTIYLPSGVNSSTGALSGWWMVTFPSMSTWTT